MSSDFSMFAARWAKEAYDECKLPYQWSIELLARWAEKQKQAQQASSLAPSHEDEILSRDRLTAQQIYRFIERAKPGTTFTAAHVADEYHFLLEGDKGAAREINKVFKTHNFVKERLIEGTGAPITEKYKDTGPRRASFLKLEFPKTDLTI